MATQVTRVNPLDLQGNIAIGVSLPFNQPGVFKSTYSTQDQIKSNLLNLLLTNKKERPFNPEFGANLRLIIFEGITEETFEIVRASIIESVNIFMPEIQVKNIDIVNNYENSISITISYKINISGTADQITVEFI